MKVPARVIVNGAEDWDDLEITMETVSGYYFLAYDEVKTFTEFRNSESHDNQLYLYNHVRHLNTC